MASFPSSFSQVPGGPLKESEQGTSSQVPKSGATNRRASVASLNSVVYLNSGLRAKLPNVLDNIRDWKPSAKLCDNYPYEICGRSNIGSPVLVLKLGAWDFRRPSSSAAKDQFIQYIDHMYSKLDERMKKNSRIVERVVTQFLIVADFTGFGLRQVLSCNGMSNIRSMTRRYEEVYLGGMEAIYAVNASFSSRLLFALTRSTVSSETLGTLQVFGSDQNQWKTALLSVIPADQLPFTLGGTVVPAGTHSMDYKKLVYGRRYSIFAEAVKEQEPGDADGEEEEEGAEEGREVGNKERIEKM